MSPQEYQLELHWGSRWGSQCQDNSRQSRHTVGRFCRAVRCLLDALTTYGVGSQWCWCSLSSPFLTNCWCFQVRKLQDKVSKCQDNVKKSKDQYELAVSDINNYNSRYQEVNKKASTGDWPWLHKWLFLRIWRMYLNVVRGRRPSGCRHLKTLYSKYTNVWTSAKTRRKLKQPITGHLADC